MSAPTTWGTDDELSFLRHLGEPFFNHRREEASPEQKRLLLEGYLEGAERRANWEKMDPVRIIAEARKLLGLARKEAV